MTMPSTPPQIRQRQTLQLLMPQVMFEIAPEGHEAGKLRGAKRGNTGAQNPRIRNEVPTAFPMIRQKLQLVMPRVVFEFAPCGDGAGSARKATSGDTGAETSANRKQIPQHRYYPDYFDYSGFPEANRQFFWPTNWGEDGNGSNGMPRLPAGFGPFDQYQTFAPLGRMGATVTTGHSSSAAPSRGNTSNIPPVEVSNEDPQASTPATPGVSSGPDIQRNPHPPRAPIPSITSEPRRPFRDEEQPLSPQQQPSQQSTHQNNRTANHPLQPVQPTTKTYFLSFREFGTNKPISTCVLNLPVDTVPSLTTIRQAIESLVDNDRFRVAEHLRLALGTVKLSFDLAVFWNQGSEDKGWVSCLASDEDVRDAVEYMDLRGPTVGDHFVCECVGRKADAGACDVDGMGFRGK